jgi:hypothetical protein
MAGAKVKSERDVLLRAKDALAAGDHRTARRLAAEVLADPSLDASRRAQAEHVLGATGLDRSAIVGGALFFAVLVALFVFVLTQRH